MRDPEVVAGERVDADRHADLGWARRLAEATPLVELEMAEWAVITLDRAAAIPRARPLVVDRRGARSSLGSQCSTN